MGVHSTRTLVRRVKLIQTVWEISSMSMKNLVAASAVLVALAGCGGGDVKLGVATTDNSVDNSTGGGGGGGTTNPCASYTTAGGTVRQGTFDGTDCTYSSSFVGQTNPLTVDLTIPLIDGVHIFEGSLFVGTSVDTAAPAGGEGPTLTIDAGNTLAFSDADRKSVV